MKNKKENRLQTYLEHVQRIKEKKPLNQISEAEVLQFFIPACMNFIEECPTTSVGQQGVINMICLRSSLHPEYEKIKKIISSFLFAINTYLKESTEQDAGTIQNMQSEIFTIEAILIKIIQSAIYCSGLFLDNLLLGISRFRGSKAELQLHELTQKIEFGREFWKQFYQQFLQDPCSKAYKTLLNEKEFSIRREKNFLIIHFQTSQYFQSDQAEDKSVLSRIQKRYEQADIKIGIDCMEILRNSARIIKRQEIDTGDYEHLCAYILAMDTLGATCMDVFQAGEDVKDATSLENWIFHLQQVEYMVLMTKIAMDTIWSELAAIFTYPTPQMQALQILTRSISPRTAHRFWAFLFLCEFENQLIQKADEDSNKISLRRLYERKIPLHLLKKVLESGLKKEQQQELISLNSKNKTFHFRPQQRDELQKIITQIPDSSLQDLLSQAWEESQFQPEIQLALNLKTLARGTTNLSQKITEVLDRFGIDLGGKQEA